AGVIAHAAVLPLIAQLLQRRQRLLGAHAGLLAIGGSYAVLLQLSDGVADASDIGAAQANEGALHGKVHPSKRHQRCRAEKRLAKRFFELPAAIEDALALDVAQFLERVDDVDQHVDRLGRMSTAAGDLAEHWLQNV